MNEKQRNKKQYLAMFDIDLSLNMLYLLLNQRLRNNSPEKIKKKPRTPLPNYNTKQQQNYHLCRQMTSRLTFSVQQIRN